MLKVLEWIDENGGIEKFERNNLTEQIKFIIF